VAYLLDANVFIQAKNLQYGFDFCPGFWDWLAKANKNGSVYSIDKIGDELLAGSDELSVWAGNQGENFFLSMKPEMINAMKAVSEWVFRQRYEQAAINTFMQVADYYLVSHALLDGFVVVTHEIVSNTTKKVKIPDVCAGLGIKYVSVFEMLRRERVRLVLG
jgi:hypothetical protein